jgi:hypothetical protein
MAFLTHSTFATLAISAIALGLATTQAQAAASYLAKAQETPTVVATPPELCHSTEEYVKTLKFLRETKDFGFREDSSRKIADEVSKGCDGAAERFSQILLLLKTIGLSERKSLEMALEFAMSPPDVQLNFVEIFTKTFLAEFFDYEYSRAMKIALELSRDFKGNPAIARKDFIELVSFCKNSDKLDLPMVFCAEYAVKVARLGAYFKDGVAQPFLEFFVVLRDKKELSLDVKTALEVAYETMKHGPLSNQNFLMAFDFASLDFGYDKRKAIEFSIGLAARSHVGSTPPVVQVAVAHLNSMQPVTKSNDSTKLLEGSITPTSRKSGVAP